MRNKGNRYRLDNGNINGNSGRRKRKGRQAKIIISSSSSEGESYQVEDILDKRTDIKTTRQSSRSITYYLIKWKGYTSPTWQPVQNITGCLNLLIIYQLQRLTSEEKQSIKQYIEEELQLDMEMEMEAEAKAKADNMNTTPIEEPERLYKKLMELCTIVDEIERDRFVEYETSLKVLPKMCNIPHPIAIMGVVSNEQEDRISYFICQRNGERQGQACLSLSLQQNSSQILISRDRMMRECPLMIIEWMEQHLVLSTGEMEHDLH